MPNLKRMNLIDVLLIEDNEGDILLIHEALEEVDFNLNLHVIKNGREALDYINQKASVSTFPLPNLIIMDINLPFLNGFEILSKLKTNPLTQKIPVNILTTSSSESDIEKAYQLHANCFTTKPIDMEEFMSTIHGIFRFWTKHAQLV